MLEPCAAMTAEPVEAETLPVAYRVLSVDRVAGAGELIALATVEMDISGVVLTLQGVQVRSQPDGRRCGPPRWRHPRTGKWLPCLSLPPELAEVLAEMERTDDPREVR